MHLRLLCIVACNRTRPVIGAGCKSRLKFIADLALVRIFTVLCSVSISTNWKVTNLITCTFTSVVVLCTYFLLNFTRTESPVLLRYNWTEVFSFNNTFLYLDHVGFPGQSGGSAHLGLSLFPQNRLLYNQDSDDLQDQRATASLMGRITAEMVRITSPWIC